MSDEEAAVMRDVRALVDECRAGSLWHLRSDWSPETPAEAVAVLEAIGRRCDLDAFRRAGRLREWLLLHSSATSAG